MASLITHLVIGERVYPRVEQLASDPNVYGTFLLGCVLADVNILGGIDRRRTHFVGRFSEDGEDAFTQSSVRFLAQRDALLRCPWDVLSDVERAFVAGYLCHLAADEAWKAFGWRFLQTLGIASPGDLPMPPGVIGIASSVLSTGMYVDYPAVASALQGAFIPDVLNHVPYGAFVRMWDILRPYALMGQRPESYFEFLAQRGRSEAEIQVARQEYDRYGEEAVALIREMGGVEPAVLRCVEPAAERVPRLWSTDR